MTILDFARHVRTKLAPYNTGLGVIDYATLGDGDGRVTAIAVTKRGEPCAFDDQIDAAGIDHIIHSAAWSYAVAVDFLIGGGAARAESEAILRALAKRCGKTIDD